MMGNWKKAENEDGFVYYINNETNLKQWDHPKIEEIKQLIDECNYVTFSSYRLALKLRTLQRSLYMEEVPLSLINAIFERHKLGQNESSLILETFDLEALLSDIFYASNKTNHTNTDIDFATEITMNFFFNVFDSAREKKMDVVSVKTLLAILSNCTLVELQHYFFSLFADHNNCITRLRLQTFLVKVFELIKYLHEDVSFGQSGIKSAVEKCFYCSPGYVGISESTFISWLESTPHFLSWLPLIFRLKSAETVMHAVKCTTCKTKPLMGLRYRCMRCSRYNQCQRCFLTGRVSHSHKLSHFMREYSGQTQSRKDDSNRIFWQICRIFCSLSKDVGFTIIRPAQCLDKNKGISSGSKDVPPEIEPLSSPEAQLQGVIRQLESQNRELQQILIFGNYKEKEMTKYLEEYRIFMAENIKKLKILKSQINTPLETERPKSSPTKASIIQSTPMVLNELKRCKSMDMQGPSPVTIVTEIEDNGYCDKKCENNVETFTPRDHYNIWIKNNTYDMRAPTVNPQEHNSPVKLLHNDLDDALARLQQILAHNFSMEDSLNPLDNTNLQFAVTEVEGMLSSIIDNVESSRCSSVMQGRTKS